MTGSRPHVLAGLRLLTLALLLAMLLLAGPGRTAQAAAVADSTLLVSAFDAKLQYLSPGAPKWKSLSTKTFTANSFATWKVKFHKAGDFKLRLKATVKGVTTISPVNTHTVLPAYDARHTYGSYLEDKALRDFQRQLCRSMYEGIAEISSYSYPGVSAVMKAYTVMGSSRDCDDIATAQAMRNALYAGLLDYGLTRGRDAAADALWGRWMDRVLSGVRIGKDSGELLKGAWNKFVLAQISSYYDAAAACIHARTGLFEKAACVDNGYLSSLTARLL
jgi:hypothetical protein